MTDADTLRAAHERLGGVSTPAMRGDNLAILLCSYFEDLEGERDDNGWTESAIKGCDEVLDAIRAHYNAALATLSKPEPAAVGEPVAWLYTHKEGNRVVVPMVERAENMKERGWTETPLYASPVPSGGAETLAAKQAREVMNPGFGSVTAPSSGQSYGMLSGCMDFTEPSPSEAISPPDARQEFNINEPVRAKLTEKGMDILRRDAEDLRAQYPSLSPWTPPAVDEEGYSEFQLWTLMRSFGAHIIMGCELPFETTITLKSRRPPDARAVVEACAKVADHEAAEALQMAKDFQSSGNMSRSDAWAEAHEVTKKIARQIRAKKSGNEGEGA